MAHFAKLAANVVIFVAVGRDEDDGKEMELTAQTGEVYKQTSYNTRAGVHYQADGTPSADQSKAFRKNYAGIGYTYDEVLDAFIPPQPYPSWVLNLESCNWESPVSYPVDGKKYVWDEASQSWVPPTGV
jgi:hypothetical protein